MNLRALIIAPTVDGISWADEVQLIARNFTRPVILTGNVNVTKIMMVTVDDVFDVIHFAGHCDADGGQLSDGRWTLVDMLGTANHVGARLFFLNGCESARPGSYFKSHGFPAVIAWTIDVIDTRALRIAAFYYEKLFEMGDIHEAFTAVNPRDGSMEFFANGSYTHLGLEKLQVDVCRMMKALVFGAVAFLVMALVQGWQAYILQVLLHK